MKELLKKSPVFLMLAAACVGLFALSLILPDRQYSENENKYLTSRPTATLSSVVDGSFEKKLSNYISDQLPGRDLLISGKSLAEALLQKSENNGVIYGEDGYLFQKFQSYDEKQLLQNLESIKAFADKADCSVTLLAVPSSYAVHSDKLPAGAVMADQQEGLATAQGYLSGSCGYVDLFSLLSAHSSEYIYFKTDHHWTASGAKYAYDALCGKLGLSVGSFGGATEVPGFLGTSYSRCKKSDVQSDTLSFFGKIYASIVIGEREYDSIYDFEKLATRDKYAMFLHGNSAKSVITAAPSADKKKSLLVIKDSFADSLVPFLTANYESITCIDPRYYQGSFSELLDEDFDDIVLIFGFENLSGERSIIKLGTT